MANAAITAALIASQQQALAQAQVTTPLKQAGATSSRTAIPLDLTADGADKLLAALVKQGHVRAAGGNRYWLDEEAIARSKASASRGALILLAFLLSAAASRWALSLGAADGQLSPSESSA
jgi:hypothetical protein